MSSNHDVHTTTPALPLEPGREPPINIKVDDVQKLMELLHTYEEPLSSPLQGGTRSIERTENTPRLGIFKTPSRLAIYRLLIYRSNDQFIRVAYYLLLGRLPDLSGLQSFHQAMRNRQQSRLGLLLDILNSQESKLKGSALALSKIEIFIIRILKYLTPIFILDLLFSADADLPLQKFSKNSSNSIDNASIENSIKILERNLSLIAKALGHLRESTQIEENSILEDIQELKQLTADNRQQLQVLIPNSKAMLEELEKIRLHEASLKESIAQTRAKQSILEKRLETNLAPSGTVSESPSKPNIDSSPAAAMSGKRFDEYYYEFERSFRGSEQDVKDRLSFYLDLTRSDLGPALDLGCGRGEWLELLQEHGYDAYGIDLNEAAIERCRKKNLRCHLGDGLSHLRALPENSLGLITGFHIAEHLTWELVLELIEESFRVLKTGGALILETPNPENILVGSCYFYHDPTHRNPIVPSVLQFTVKYFGFTAVDILRFRPSSYLDTIQTQQWAQPLLNSFNASQDFAVIGRKGEI